MKIFKVKVMKGDKISIDYSRPSGNAMIKSNCTCQDKARPEFYNTLKELKSFARGICEFQNETEIELPGVSFSYHGEAEVLGVIFTVSKKPAGISRPVNRKYTDKICRCN